MDYKTKEGAGMAMAFYCGESKEQD